MTICLTTVILHVMLWVFIDDVTKSCSMMIHVYHFNKYHCFVIMYCYFHYDFNCTSMVGLKFWFSSWLYIEDTLLILVEQMRLTLKKKLANLSIRMFPFSY